MGLDSKRGISGQSMCYLCNGAKEDMGHLIIQCSYGGQNWKDIEKMTCISNVCNGTSIEECLGKWFGKELIAFRDVPCLVLWGILMAHNHNLFSDKQKPTFQVYC
jgi:hypothetical protein